MLSCNSILHEVFIWGYLLARSLFGSILNSFSCPYTNGFTEGVNNKIKALKRNAYGYRSFRRFRNRILHMFYYPIQKGAA
jgi:hypothetical protein